MKRAIVTVVMVMAAATWAFSQNYPSQTGQSTSSDKTTTIQGCLGRTDGGFTLTDKSGARFEVSDTAMLNDHVGHEVQITGTKSEAAAPSSTTGETGNRNEARIDVSSVKHISETCKSKPETQNPPMSEKPPLPPR
jgi:Protein of unknown function (DUF5818)